MYFKKQFTILPIIILYLLTSCGGAEEVELFTFTSPQTNWKYYNDEIILFSINYKSYDVIWESSINGYLGTGNQIYSYLEPGLHTITASVDNKINSISINVEYRKINEIRSLVTGVPFYQELKPGIYFPYISSPGSGVLRDFTFSINDKDTSYNPYNRNKSIMLRDVRIEFNGNIVKKSMITAFNAGVKSFFVESTLQNGLPPKLIDFTHFYEGDLYNIWTDNNSTVNALAIKYFIVEIDKIIPQVISIWGDWADIDNDGKITILITNVINQENKAYGFFNPYDLFPNDINTSSINYNPNSNEMDIIYLAMPNDYYDDSYYYKRIAATFTHELTHIINFSRKTWGRSEVWNLSQKREILPIDEGLSHLSECLTGYSISGDNQQFINHFLEGTGHYSLFGRNGDGLFDSVGMRGAITLFLSWLFWEKGGINWDDDGNIIDLGGISFLRLFTGSDGIGTDNISKTFGEPIEHLFHKMLAKINTQRMLDVKHECIFHPNTGEPVNFFTNMEYINCITNEIEMIILPVSYNKINYLNHSLVSWSFAFLDPVYLQLGEQIIFSAARYTGNVFLNYGVSK